MPKPPGWRCSTSSWATSSTREKSSKITLLHLRRLNIQPTVVCGVLRSSLDSSLPIRDDMSSAVHLQFGAYLFVSVLVVCSLVVNTVKSQY